MFDHHALRLLILMRHAEAMPHSPTGDLGRTLSSAGRIVAQAVGGWLQEQGVRPDAALVSPSVRTQQTWEALREGGLVEHECWVDRALYDAATSDIIESISAVPDAVQTLLVVGHAPGIPSLAADLADHVSVAQEARPSQGWPPASVAIVGHPGAWTVFPARESAVVAFHRP